MKKAFLLRFLTATLVITTLSVSIGNITRTSYAMAAEDGAGGVWNSEVIAYLNANDYEGVEIISISDTGDRTCTSTNHPGYYTTVYVLNGRISGHEDWPGGKP